MLDKVLVIALLITIVNIALAVTTQRRTKQEIRGRDIESEILYHIKQQSAVTQSIIDSEYMREAVGDMGEVMSLANLSLGLYYLAIIQADDMSSTTESVVSDFVRHSLELHGSYNKEVSVVENND